MGPAEGSQNAARGDWEPMQCFAGRRAVWMLRRLHVLGCYVAAAIILQSPSRPGTKRTRCH
jgi:hypothetical protein